MRQVLSGPGAPLEAGIRRLMEERLGADFGHVRVHTGERAAASAGALGAEAYTAGGSVVFAAGRYAPYREDGRELLAHELVHTLQQDAGGPAAGGRHLSVEPPGSPAETEAQAVARASRHGWPPGTARQVSRVPSRLSPSRVPLRGVIQCQRVPEVSKDVESYLGLEAISPADIARQDEVANAYRQLVPHELARIRGIIAKLPSQIVELPEFASSLKDVETRWAQEASWTPENRAKQLPPLVKDVNNLALRSEAAGRSPVQGKESQAEPTWLTGNDRIAKAINLLQDKVVNAINSENSEVTGSIALLFGEHAPEATARIKEIVALLGELNARTWLNPGYQLDPRLPESMAAQASEPGWTSFIGLSPGTLSGTVPLEKFATVLLHEGSHLIADPTVDFAYRRSGQQYVLPAKMALYNAANYEQVAAKAVGDTSIPPPKQEDITLGRSPGAPVEMRAASLVTVRITRAWSLAYRLHKTLDKGLPRSFPRRILTDLKLPQAPNTGPLVTALLGGLFPGLDVINRIVQAGLVIRQADSPKEEIIEDGGRNVVEMPPQEVRQDAAGLARAVLLRLCEKVPKSKTPLTAGQILAFILSAEELEDQRLKGMVTDYTGALADKPSKSEQVND